MSEFEFQSFPQATEDARALLSRLYREIGLLAVSTALDLTTAAEAPRARETLADLQAMVQSAHAKAA